MFANYLVTAIRNLARHKLYSFINIAGLTVGLTCAIFILLFVRDQLSYDRWIPGTENVYRLESALALPGKPAKPVASSSYPASQAMLDQIPEVQARTRLARQPTTLLVGNRQFSQRVYIVDPNFLQVIPLPLVAGDPTAVFAKPESMVLSQTAARRYFGNASAVGKTIVISRRRCDDIGQHCEIKQTALAVTGILKDLPHNSQFEADVVIPNTTAAFPINKETRENWFWLDRWSYLRLAPGTDPKVVTAKFKTVLDRMIDPSKQLNVKVRGSELLVPSLTPLLDAHLSTDRFGGITPPGSWSMVWGFGTIGALILLIACFNFTNMATARAMMRAREIALRKVVGAERTQLIVQFLGEALVTTGVALVLALALTEMLMPVFDRVLGLPLAIHYVQDWPVLLLILAIATAAGLLSGAYPALVLSGFRPAISLRTQQGGLAGSGWLRTLLVVLQFAVSIGLGVAAVVIFSQISFSRNVELGFRKDSTVILDIRSLPPESADSLTRALRTGPDIVDAATSDDVPFNDGHNHVSVQAPGATSSENFVLVPAGPDYMPIYGIKLLAGRLLAENRPADGLVPSDVRANQPFNVLINATAARRMGYSPETAVGKTLQLASFLRNKVTVVGVMADVKHDGPKKPVDGTVYMYWRSFPVEFLSVRLRPGHEQAALAFIQQTWHSHVPSIALQRHFLTDDYDKQFQSDDRQATLFGVFVGIAIFIACLGLFGLAAFSTERRTREIGLRKAFGAETGDIVRMLLWQFSIPVLIANAIAWPVAWYYLHDWLQGFAYRIVLSPLYFLGAGAAALLIAWVTVFVHARRVADANPIHALRYE